MPEAYGSYLSRVDAAFNTLNVMSLFNRNQDIGYNSLYLSEGIA